MQPHCNSEIYRAACEWLVEFRSSEPDEAARRAFHAWLQASPAHMGAYLDVSANWTWAAAIDPTGQWSKEQLLQDARADVGNVTPFADVSAPPRQPSKRRWLAYAAVLITVSLIGTLFWIDRDPRYATGSGEQHSLTLSDGSTVQLDSQSKITIHYTAHERAVDLVKGQALFQVAKDSVRPFVVQSGPTRVRAVGTQFDVRRTEHETIVTVVEGRVAVSSSPQTVGPLLTGGEQVTVSPTAAHRTAHPNLPGATAWTQRKFVFDATPLSEVAEEFNRYNKRQLQIRDPSLRAFQIDGVFSSADPSLIRFLRERPEMQVAETDREIIVTRRPGAM